MLDRRRAQAREVYSRVYRNYPNYTNKPTRIELTTEWIANRMEGTRPWLLDVGCGRGEVIASAREIGVHAVGCDIVPELCEQDYVTMIDGADSLPYGDEAFDLVTCTDVLEHIPEEDVRAVLSELRRVGRGWALLTVCHRPDTPGKFGTDSLHVTVKPREWWEPVIAEAFDAQPTALYLERVNSNGTWFEVNACG